jgi:hypothetical protein
MRLIVAAFGCLVPLAATVSPLVAQEPQASNERYGPTMQFGTGLINAPTAWIAPQSSDFWMTYSAERIPSNPQDVGFSHGWNGNGAIDTHWLGRFSVGLSVYSNNPDWGFFGQGLILKDGEHAKWQPALAVGFRNLGPYDHEDRFLIGHDVAADSISGTHGITAAYFKHFHTLPTLYAVATKSIAFSDLVSLGLTLGYGDGLFSDDGGLGASYDRHGQLIKGLFFGGQFQIHPDAVSSVSLIVENDAWNYNAGIRGEWRGVGLGIYATELEEGTTKRPSDFLIYNYTKINFAVSYAGSFRDVGRGVFLRSEISQLEREQIALRSEVARRERRIKDLQVALQKLQGSALSDVERQRQDLEAQLKQEQDEIRRASERLKELQGEKPQ